MLGGRDSMVNEISECFQGIYILGMGSDQAFSVDIQQNVGVNPSVVTAQKRVTEPHLEEKRSRAPWRRWRIKRDQDKQSELSGWWFIKTDQDKESGISRVVVGMESLQRLRKERVHHLGHWRSRAVMEEKRWKGMWDQGCKRQTHSGTASLCWQRNRPILPWHVGKNILLSLDFFSFGHTRSIWDLRSPNQGSNPSPLQWRVKF